MTVPMWAPFMFLALVCLLCPRPAKTLRCKCQRHARCAVCMERDGLTKPKESA